VKKKKERGRSGPARGAGWAVWAIRAEREPALVFSFFLFFFFKLHFQTKFISNSNQTFQTFSQEFYRLLETSQATKNHASQLMMHKHLLSLSLLNYI
jgi:hypothetical protein